jgi:hypothetical protein
MKYYNIEEAFSSLDKNSIPFIIPVFNLVSSLKIAIEQFNKLGIENFIICDNNSTYQPMVEYLDEISKDFRVLYLNGNVGPRIYITVEEFINMLPEYFVLTDPDLVYNENLPKNFVEQMINKMNKLNYSRIGFALEINLEDEKEKFFNNEVVQRTEQKFWQDELDKMDDGSPVYAALIDTTFAIYNKEKVIQSLHIENYNIPALRVSGNYTCSHLGYWKEEFIPYSKEEFDYYKNSQIWSTSENVLKK